MRALTIFGACFVVLLALLWTRSESYFPLYPTIDTQLPLGFSEEKFTQIKPGMTRTEVAAVLPGSPEPESLPWNKTTWQYGNDGGCNSWCDLAWIGFSIYFDPAGRVTDLERSIYMD